MISGRVRHRGGSGRLWRACPHFETLMATDTQTPVKPGEAKLSPVEGIKTASRQLRGTIALDLVNDTDHFGEADKQLLKFHGTYQQEDRDARKNRKKDGVGKHYMFMVRCKIPGGRLTAAQYLAMDDLTGKYANGTLRFTSRQGIQFHGVLKTDLKSTIAGINESLLSTLGACGDVERNVMACPAPHCDGIHAQLQETAAILAAHLAPRSRGYHEIWLNGAPIADSADNPQSEIRNSQYEEPLYGKTYLPRKFKTGLALPEDNCIDIHAQDLGLLAIVEKGKIVGYNILVGGGMGMTHGNAATFPHLGKPICYVPAAAIVPAAEAVIRLFRDHGNRGDRKRARIKYLVHDWGVEKFRQVLADYLGGALIPPMDVEPSGFDPHLGWHPQGDGKFFYGLSIENGRVKDDGDFRLRTALRTIVQRFEPNIRLTPLQDILLCDLDAGAREEIDKVFAEHGVKRPEAISRVRQHSMACPAIPTCGLALSESERTLPGLIDKLEAELHRLGLHDETLGVRMTGCPNGCARPYQSEIGLVGRSGDKYTLFVGGHVVGHRLNFMLRDLVPMADIVPTLVPILEAFKSDRLPSENFGDFCHRLGVERLESLLPKVAAKSGHGSAVNGQPAPAASPKPVAAEPEAKAIRVGLPNPFMERETFLAGPPGEERADFTYFYNTDGSVRETLVYYYGEDRRAAGARPDDAIRREAAYAGKADANRLFAARKRCDTFYVGALGHERRDRRVEYRAEDGAPRTVIFFYENDTRAADAPSGAPIKRQAMFDGAVN
jgi:sulfite reductase (ferredoxin)